MPPNVDRQPETTWLADALKESAVIANVRAVLGRVGRVHVPGVLEPRAAQALFETLQATEWRLLLNGEKEVYDFTAANVAAMNPAQQGQMLAVVHAQASAKFQFLFDSYRISDEYESGALTEGPFADFFAALNSEPVLQVLRALTGDNRIAYLDAQATRYRPGHFLTAHDDDIEGKNRLFAYVLNLTPNWRADWGGLLTFIDADGHVAEAFTPAWNALNILKVPQLHAVSLVAPFARGFRYSITGWMRSKRP